MAQGNPQEIVLWFDHDLSVTDEMSMVAFEQFLAGETSMPAYAASTVKAAYALVGNALSLRSAVLFSVGIDEDGRADPAFNLPLRYLAQQAGVGASLDDNPVRVSSRGQCPVPWHAVHMWEGPLDTVLDTIQRCIYRNRLKLPSTTDFDDEGFFPPADGAATIYDDAELGAHHTVLDFLGEERADGSPDDATSPLPKRSDHHQKNGAQVNQPRDEEGGRVPSGNGALQSAQQRVANSQYSARLTEVFGQSGKLSLPEMIRLHTEQMEELKLRFRQDIENQQLVYLEQLRAAKEEIRELRTALRHEQDRSRRLQELMRKGL